FIFHTKEANCVTAVRRTLAVTFAHGPHSQLSLYDIVSIYSPSTKVEHKLKVVFINKSFDLIVLESPQPLCPADPILRLPAAGEAYIQLSITQPYSTPAISATRGLILSSHLVGSGQILGSAQPAVGDLAGGCFHEASGALIGLYMG
ncbi:uncharacterized protein BJ171DRAFT_404178, partial [Polychytrium aggregatum]|uniref:uncharacterized protein n=1 Tax=Polychytrium aggregatum TaxID=110093 RepID=UPI0022FEFD08